MRRVLTEAPDEAFGYADPRGRPELRAALAGYLGRARGVRATAATLLVCAGAGHGMGVAFRALAARGARIVAVEDPSSPRLREIAAGAGLGLVPLPCDDLGGRAGDLAGMGADAVVVTPAHQYPLGVTLAPDRRNQLLAWASSGRGIIVEDDYDGELRYDRQPVGALQALDPGRVIYVGTTSKSLAAALRIGWLAVPPQLMDAMAESARLINAWPSSLGQLALARFIEAGLFDRHIRRMRGIYRQRRDLLIATLAERAPMLRVTGIAAGGYALVRLPASGPAENEVISTAARSGLALDGLAGYRFSDGTTEPAEHQPALVIGYGSPAGPKLPRRSRRARCIPAIRLRTALTATGRPAASLAGALGSRRVRFDGGLVGAVGLAHCCRGVCAEFGAPGAQDPVMDAAFTQVHGGVSGPQSTLCRRDTEPGGYCGPRTVPTYAAVGTTPERRHWTSDHRENSIQVGQRSG
jgi:DNA-binding transcriptional MocR family regulator